MTSCPASRNSRASPSRSSAWSSATTIRTAAPPAPACRPAGRRRRAASRRGPRTRSAIPARPRPGTATAPPGPSSSTVTTRWPSTRSASTSIEAGVACLRALARASLTTKYAAASTSAANRSSVTSSTVRTGVRPASSASAGPSPASRVEGRTPWASSRSSRIASPSRRTESSSWSRTGDAGVEAGLQVPQVEADRDQLLLGAVVEVALEPAPLVERRADDPGPRALDLRELPEHLDPQPGDLDGQPARTSRCASSLRTAARSACTTVASGRSPRRTGVRPGGSAAGRGRGSPWTSAWALLAGQPVVDDAASRRPPPRRASRRRPRARGGRRGGRPGRCRPAARPTSGAG